MIKGMEGVTLFSANPKQLADFYGKTVGVKMTFEAELGGGDDLYGFEAKGGANLYITSHSRVKGKNSQPERMIVNWEVDDIEKETARLKKAKVKLVADIYHIQDYGYIATFEDPDGNYFQLVKTKA